MFGSVDSPSHGFILQKILPTYVLSRGTSFPTRPAIREEEICRRYKLNSSFRSRENVSTFQCLSICPRNLHFYRENFENFGLKI